MTRAAMTRALVALAAGLVFALGLGLSGMTQPAKVISFLDVAGTWDPSLAFVMVGAIGVHALVLRLDARRSAPLLSDHFDAPPARSVDAPLLLGSALFGLGWGVSGFCPGPALVGLSTGSLGVAAFVCAMALGSWLVRRFAPRLLSDG
jgi:uncharacterized membrane protein YedE/YeeE